MTHLGQLLPSRNELRAIARRYRSPRRPSRPVHAKRAASPPREWMGTVEAPFESVEDARIRLNEVEATFRAAGDRRSVFLTVYTEMTEAVEAGLDSGFFDDPAWVERTLVTFADHYRRALVAYERGKRRRVPPPWEVGFDATLGGSTLLLQDALFGVNAHINYDLTYALDEVGIDPDRGQKFEDYARINRILDRLVDTVQETLVEIYDAGSVATLDPLFGPLDEELVFYGLRSGRRFAWDNAEILADHGGSFRDGCVDWRVRNVSTGVALLIRSPSADRELYRQFVDAELRRSPVEDFRRTFTGLVPPGGPERWAPPRADSA